jgi:glycosyltransferase involved in cell wall biosynthesis
MMTAVQVAPPDTSARARICACIIACDEAASLPDCLASLDFCDEIVLVDSGSADETPAIARAAGARVVEQAWLGFAAQRNVALDHATAEWLLEVDADERVSPELREEILRFLSEVPPNVELGGVPRRELLVGHRLGPSAKYPKYAHRVLRRGRYRHDEARTVHEGLEPEGPVHPFEGELVHLLAGSWPEAVGDAWRYARLEAGQMQGPSSMAAYLRGALLRPLAKLIYRLVIDGGWRDGWPGVAKISLDCATDTVVWTRHLLGRRGDVRGLSGVPAGLHYGSRRVRRGHLRVVGVALDAAGETRAVRWLGRARAGGADVALIVCGRSEGHDAVRVRRLPRFGPLALIRALDAEDQLRPIDALVTFDRRARLLARMVPRGLRGWMEPITQETDPAAVNWRSRGLATDVR